MEASPAGLKIGATCRIAELYRFEPPRDWLAAPLIRACCDALLASFKIWNAATVGGNICMSLPAGAMISLVIALEGRCTLWPREGAPRIYQRSISSPATTPTRCVPANCCARSICRLRHSMKRAALRRASLTKLGRSAALLIGTSNPERTRLPADDHCRNSPSDAASLYRIPSAEALRQAIDVRIPADGYFADVHGSASYKRHLTLHFAEQICAELASPGARA